ncbi:MAG: LacI family DNA-binding transcriptional regulator [Chitinophagaceae bacterium]|nr:LacI family DNA-binding transcriptional regulator [Chitinophagaceae bacterium]
MKGSVTIKDVAAALGISVSTVSRAMRNAKDVSEETKLIVLKKAKQLQYQPNYSAQSLINRKTNLIGVIVPVIHSNYFSSAISGISDVLSASNYQMMICQSSENYEKEKAAIDKLLSYNIDGLLISVSKSTKNDKAINEVVKKNIPIVMFDRIIDSVDCSKVIVNEYEGAYKAVEHLIKKGCKRIAHLAGPKDLLISHNRKQGYLDAMADHKIKVNPNMVVHCQSFEDDAPRAFKKILKNDPLPDAIFFINDLSAIDCMKYLNRKGLSIPHDIKIVGFNNDLVSTASDPTLTTVMQPSYEVGKLSAGLLLDEIEGKKTKHIKYELRTKLVVRESTQKR